MIKCRSCKADTGEYLLLFGDQPKSAQKLPTTMEEAVKEKTILDIRQCPKCGLIQLANSPVPYYKEVIRASGSSPSLLKKQYNAFARFIFQFNLDQKRVVEIGSGNGEYLPLLTKLEVEATGIPGYPDDTVVGPFDAFICINFLEHLPDPGEFLELVTSLITDDGVGMISVPDSELSLQQNHLFSFMSDHLLYFTKDSLHTLLSLNGLKVLALFTNYDLGVLTAYVVKKPKLDAMSLKKRFVNAGEGLDSLLNFAVDRGEKIAIWGASHFAFSIISSIPLRFLDSCVSYIVDSSPIKQGKFSPVSGLPIYPPEHLLEEPVNTILIASPEYYDEIRKTIEEKYPGHTIVQLNG